MKILLIYILHVCLQDIAIYFLMWMQQPLIGCLFAPNFMIE